MPAPINDLAVDLLRRYTNTLGSVKRSDVSYLLLVGIDLARQMSASDPKRTFLMIVRRAIWLTECCRRGDRVVAVCF
jgi:hypothetical protein